MATSSKDKFGRERGRGSRFWLHFAALLLLAMINLLHNTSFRAALRPAPGR